MMNGSKPNLFNRVREALLMDWDPIGIQDFPGAHDEYDSYVPELCELLMRKEPIDTVVSYLWQLETCHMGLRGDRSRTHAFAERLISMETESD
jgi:hypothetical protein